MRRRRRLLPLPTVLACVLLACALPVPVGAQAPDSTLASAERSARSWLSQLDAGQYRSAWTLVAPAMRGSTTYDEWVTSLRSLRTVLPLPAARTLLRAEHGGRLFGGESVLLTFTIAGTALREIVVLVRDGPDWRAAGYGVLLPQ